MDIATGFSNQKISAEIPSIHKRTSDDMMSTSDLMCKTTVYVLRDHESDTNEYLPNMHNTPPDVKPYQPFHRNLHPDNKPNLHSFAVFPTRQ